MKKKLLLFAVFLYSINNAQIYHETDKEGLRNILRQESAVDGKLNLEHTALSIADTLDWYTSEKWITKIMSQSKPYFDYDDLVSILWNNDIPKRINTIVLSGKIDFSYTTEYLYKGIFNGDYFPELTTLKLPIGKFSEVNLKNNINLNSLEIAYNDKLEKLDLSNNINLSYIEAMMCNLNEINLPNDLSKLISIDVSDNNLTSFNLNTDNINNLKYMNCTANFLALSKLPDIKKLPRSPNYFFNLQKTIEYGNVEVGEEIDLSSEYEIGGVVSSFQWYRNNEPIELKSTGNGIFLADAKYAGESLICEIINKNYLASSPPFDIEYASFEHKVNINKQHLNLVDKKNISIYPNPAHEKVFINTNEKVLSIEIYNSAGKIIKAARNSKELSIKELNPGVYFLHIKTEKETYKNTLNKK